MPDALPAGAVLLLELVELDELAELVDEVLLVEVLLVEVVPFSDVPAGAVEFEDVVPVPEDVS